MAALAPLQPVNQALYVTPSGWTTPTYSPRNTLVGPDRVPTPRARTPSPRGTKRRRDQAGVSQAQGYVTKGPRYLGGTRRRRKSRRKSRRSMYY